MLPMSQSLQAAPSASPLYTSVASFPSFGFPDVSGGLSHDQFAPLHVGGGLLPVPGADPHSPEMFKQNIQIAAAHIVRVQDLAQSALSGIEHAYHAGTNPLQTATYLTALKQSLLALIDLLRQSGVGALPLIPPNHATALDPAVEQQQLTESGQAVQALFERWKRIQESAGVAASLLAAPEHPTRK